MHLGPRGEKTKSSLPWKIRPTLSPNASATRRRSAVLLVPCQVPSSNMHIKGCIMEQEKHLACVYTCIKNNKASFMKIGIQHVYMFSKKRPNVRNILQTSRPSQQLCVALWAVYQCVTQSGWVWFHTHPKWWEKEIYRIPYAIIINHHQTLQHVTLATGLPMLWNQLR